MALEALRAAAERGDRTLTDFVGGQRGHERQAAAALFRRRAASRPSGLLRDARGCRGGGSDADLRLRRPRWLRRQRAARRQACVVVVVRGLRGLRLVVAEALLGFLLGLLLRLVVVTAALVLGLLAGLGGFAFGLLDAFAAGAARGFLFGDPALFDFANLGVGKRARARVALLFGQRAQQHAARRVLRGRLRPVRRGLRCGRRRPCRRGSGSRLRLDDDRRIAGHAALRLLLDHHLLGAAVAEALAHGARLRPRLERQSFRADAERLVAGSFRFSHPEVLNPYRARSPASCYLSFRLPSRRAHWPGTGRGHGSATGKSCRPGQQAALHVSHLP